MRKIVIAINDEEEVVLGVQDISWEETTSMLIHALQYSMSRLEKETSDRKNKGEVNDSDEKIHLSQSSGDDEISFESFTTVKRDPLVSSS